MGTGVPLLVAAGLVLLGGLFAMTDSAVAVVSAARAAELARAGVRGARALQAVASDIKRYINLLMLLRLVCEAVATTAVSLVAVKTFGLGWLAALVAAGSMSVISFVAVGVAPRTLGRQHAYTVGRIMAGPLRWLGRALGPLTSLLILVGNAVTPGKGFRDGPFATTVELRELVDLAEQRGVVEHGEREMIHSVFALGSTIAREVMVPRTEMVWIESHKTVRQALVLAMRSGFSRIAVIGESVDDVLGIVYLKDLIRHLLGGQQTRPEVLGAQIAGNGTAGNGTAGNGTTVIGPAVNGAAGNGAQIAANGGQSATQVVERGQAVERGQVVERGQLAESGSLVDALVSSVMRPASYVPESKPIDDLLGEMQAARTHIAIVVDEYGGTAGLVTIEDILEEIVGEITDEYDTAERPPIDRLDDGSVRVTSRLPVEDLGEVFATDLPSEDVETVAGLMAQALGRVPIPGATVVVAGLHLTAEGTTGRRNRIDAVLVRPVEDGQRTLSEWREG